MSAPTSTAYVQRAPPKRVESTIDNNNINGRPEPSKSLKEEPPRSSREYSQSKPKKKKQNGGEIKEISTDPTKSLKEEEEAVPTPKEAAPTSQEANGTEIKDIAAKTEQ
jgi:hypothetical protein